MVAKPRSASVQIIEDGVAARIAHILGPQCAMALAIRERDRRRANGQVAVILTVATGAVLVGPDPRLPLPEPKERAS